MADSAIRLFSPQVVHIDFSFYNAQTVNLIRSNQARVWLNSLGEPDDAIRAGNTQQAAARLTAHGATIFQTDYPKELAAFFLTQPQE